MKNELFSNNQSVNDYVYRNTPQLIDELALFDDLTDDTSAKMKALQLSQLNKPTSVLQPKVNMQKEAIDYGFKLKKWTPSRFGDGSFYVWYGANDEKTTFYETCFHWVNNFLSDAYYFQQSNNKTHITANRSVFKVIVSATLMDFRNKLNILPALVQTDIQTYQQTQEIGKKLYSEGHPGLISRSARHAQGETFAIFNKKVLSQPSLYRNIRYRYLPHKDVTEILDDADNVLLTY